MNQEYLMQVLVKPYSTEKTENQGDEQYVFKVLPAAGKYDVKAAVELMFDVKVDKVRLLNVKGKVKRYAQREGKRSDWKKAYVRLAAGQSIDYGASE